MSDSHLLDPLGRSILLSDHAWSGHIIVGHPEVKNHRSLVEDAISNPLSIRYSLRDSDCRIYYGLGPRPRVMIRVVADVVIGHVLTAHPARKFGGEVEEWSSPTP